MSCESLAADWKIFLRRTKNHSAEIEKSFGAEKYVQMRPFLIHYQTIS